MSEFLVFLRYYKFQVLKDTGLHHMNLLLTLSRLSALCFLPVWLLLDVTRMVYDENVVSFCQNNNWIEWLWMLVVHPFHTCQLSLFRSVLHCFQGQLFLKRPNLLTLKSDMRCPLLMRERCLGLAMQKIDFRAPAVQRQMRKKISFGPTSFHLAQTFGAYFFRRHFYFFLCYKRYELRKRLMTPN